MSEWTQQSSGQSILPCYDMHDRSMMCGFTGRAGSRGGAYVPPVRWTHCWTHAQRGTVRGLLRDGLYIVHCE